MNIPAVIVVVCSTAIITSWVMFYRREKDESLESLHAVQKTFTTCLCLLLTTWLSFMTYQYYMQECNR